MSILKKLFSTRLAMFMLLVIAFLAFASFKKIIVYPYDADYYWTIADSVFENRNILRFPETFRGYLFPMLVGAMKYTVNRLGIHDYWGWRILISVMISGMLVYAFPIIFRKNTSHVNWSAYLTNGIYALIFVIFWGDFIQYPLSDFPACFFVITGVAALIWAKDRANKIYKVVGGIIAGASLYAAYNTRAAYLYGALIAVIVFTINLFTRKSYKDFLVLVSLIIGILVIAAPQMMINHQYVGSLSPKVYTEQLQGYQTKLETAQIFIGLQYSKYETYNGDLADYPIPQSNFDEPVGMEILQRENVTKEGFKASSYCTLVKLFLTYPLDMSGIYMRHLLGLMTPFYTEAYVTDMYTEKGVFISLAILIWMIAAIDLLFHYKSRFDWVTWCMMIAMTLSSLMQAAGRPELRFFLMVYLLLYYYVVKIIDYKELYRNIKSRWVPIIFVCAVIYFMWISNIGMLLSHNHETVLLINDNHYGYTSETGEVSTPP